LEFARRYLKKGEYPQKGLEREVWEESKLKVKMEKIIKAWYDPALHALI